MPSTWNIFYRTRISGRNFLWRGTSPFVRLTNRQPYSWPKRTQNVVVLKRRAQNLATNKTSPKSPRKRRTASFRPQRKPPHPFRETPSLALRFIRTRTTPPRETLSLALRFMRDGPLGGWSEVKPKEPRDLGSRRRRVERNPPGSVMKRSARESVSRGGVVRVRMKRSAREGVSCFAMKWLGKRAHESLAGSKQDARNGKGGTDYGGQAHPEQAT